uniref:Rhodanese domain-containing protein n=1 Tax=Soboliphyme baturini TaxID=241478 RepID=A0A183J0C4_9BILA
LSVKRQRLDSNVRGTFDQLLASKASFEVAWLTVRNKKPYTIGEDLVKPAALKMAEITWSGRSHEATKFSALCDETTDVSSNSHLIVYVRYKSLHVAEEELLFCSPLELLSREIDVFNKANEYFNDNCIAVYVDGGPAMLDYISGFSALARENNPKLKLATI